jgi:hypothetical protein
MSRWRTSLAALALPLGASACMVFSGVDELEVRKDAPPTDPADTGAPAIGWGKDGGTLAKDGGATTDAGWKPAKSGALVCGAQGTWSACGTNVATTCAQYCVSIGKACVDNCCANDQKGNYAANLGMYYAFGTTCALDAVPSSASAGYCSDPVLPFGYDVRCCCR